MEAIGTKLRGKKCPKKLPTAVPFKRFNVGVIERRVTADYEALKGLYSTARHKGASSVGDNGDRGTNTASA